MFCFVLKFITVTISYNLYVIITIGGIRLHIFTTLILCILPIYKTATMCSGKSQGKIKSTF